MSKRSKLTKILRGLSSFEDKTDEALRSLERELTSIIAKTKKGIDSDNLKQTQQSFGDLKKSINPLFDSLTELRNKLGEQGDAIAKQLEIKVNELVSQARELRDTTGIRFITLSGQVDEIRNEVRELRNKKIELPDFDKMIKDSETGLRNTLSTLEGSMNELRDSSALSEMKDSLSEMMDDLDKRIKKDLAGLRTRINSMSTGRGGNANRNILVGNDPSVLSRYTDLNIKAGSNITLTYANNDNLKTLDLTIAASSVAGGTTRSINSVSTSQTLGATAGTDYVYIATGSPQLTLPTAVSNTNLYTIKNAGTGSVLVSTTSAQTIDDVTTALMTTQYTAVDIISDDANWHIT